MYTDAYDVVLHIQCYHSSIQCMYIKVYEQLSLCFAGFYEPYVLRHPVERHGGAAPKAGRHGDSGRSEQRQQGIGRRALGRSHRRGGRRLVKP